MKCAVLITDNEKQIFLTPENDMEKQALKYITPADDIQLETYWGTFTDEREAWSKTVSKCRGGWLRTFSHEDSLIFLLTPKKEESNESD